jgi:chromosome segregation ATPase
MFSVSYNTIISNIFIFVLPRDVMAKSEIPPNLETQLEYLRLLERLSNAPALNGGFDRLQESITEIKDIQTSTKQDITKLSYELEHVKTDFQRVENKIDRIYDPEDGLFFRISNTEALAAKTENSIDELSRKIDDVIKTNTDTKEKISSLEKTAQDITGKIKLLSSVAGENFEELQSTIKVKKNLSKMVWLFITGFFGTLAKILWDILSN